MDLEPLSACICLLRFWFIQ